MQHEIKVNLHEVVDLRPPEEVIDFIWTIVTNTLSMDDGKDLLKLFLDDILNDEFQDDLKVIEACKTLLVRHVAPQ